MILFRADGNSEIGSGHIMRCLSLADAFRSIGKESVFVCSDDTMLEIIKRRGYLCHVLNSDYQNPEGETEALLGCDYYNQAQGIVVDSYFVNHKYMDSIRINKKTVYFDDLFRSFNADGVINYNIYADSAEYKTTRSDTKFFLGPGYAPLRS